MPSKITPTFSALLDAGHTDNAEIYATELRIFREIGGKYDTQCRIQ